jgi:hypothetical protein
VYLIIYMKLIFIFFFKRIKLYKIIYIVICTNFNSSISFEIENILVHFFVTFKNSIFSSHSYFHEREPKLSRM